MDRRRLIFAIIFVAITLLLGLALYLVFFRGPSAAGPKGVIPIDTGPVTGFPSADQGFIDGGVDVGDPDLPTTGEVTDRPSLLQREVAPRTTQLFDDDIKSPSFANANTVNFYSEQDGRFYRVSGEGNLQPLSDQVFFNVDEVTWAPNSNDAIIEYPDGANIYYDFEEERQVTLPKHWEDFSFSEDGGRVAAKSVGLSPENRWLIVSNPDGSNTKLVEPLGENGDKVTVDWSPNQQVLGFSRTGDPLGANREQILLVGQNGENFQGLIVEGRGFESTWSQKGDKLAYSVFNARNDFKPELWVVNANPNNVGTNRRLLNVNTWAEKCSFDPSNQRFMYCGVPERLDTGAGFQPALADLTPDRLYRIDTQTGIQTEIQIDDNRDHTINEIMVAEDGRSLIFTDKQNEGLFEVSL